MGLVEKTTRTPAGMLSTSSVALLAGVPNMTLQMWCRSGVVKPSKAANNGKGDYRGFTPMEALGVIAGSFAYYSARGCDIKYLTRVFEAFAAMPEAALAKAIKAGKVNLVDVYADCPCLERNDPSRAYLMSCLNVAPEYDRVKAACGERQA